MAAATRPIQQPIGLNFEEVRIRSLAANANVPQGTLACNDAGDAKPFTDTLFQAGATLLGFAIGASYLETTGAAATKDMMFARGCQWIAPYAKAGDVPTLAMVGKAISVQDNQTVKATVGGSDLSVTLYEILPGGAGYRVGLPG